MKNLVDIQQLTKVNYLNLYKYTFLLENNRKKEYYFASRRNIDDLASKCKDKVDAVRALPYIKRDNKIYIVLIREFRYAINDYIYGLPAGLVDENEEPKITVKRELEEEIGADVIKLEKVQNNSFTSAGLSDEAIECFEAEVVLNKKQRLEVDEDITYIQIELDDILNFVDNNKFGLQSALQLKLFYYKNKFLEAKNG